MTQLPSPPKIDPSLGLPCTPLSVGVGPNPGGGANTDVAIVDVPQLTTPATVVLTFPDEALPNEGLEKPGQYWISNLPPGSVPSDDNPNNLTEFYPGDPGLGSHQVQACNAGPTIPAGQDSCIVSVLATYSGNATTGYTEASGDPSDPVEVADFDEGTITLLVQGSGLGDPAYVG